MRFSLASLLAYGLAVDAHTIFQKVSVNGKDNGQLTGLRAPGNNNPVQDVTSQNMICGQSGSKSSSIINVAAGDRIGSYWQHVIGGAQFAGDPDNPIAKSHKGPVMAYLAKVDNAASVGLSGLKWFKVWQDTFDTSSRKWGVDNMMSNNGQNPGAQPKFYQSCAQINVSGSGTLLPSSTVSFPGAYKANDPGILINIYGLKGVPDMDGKPYTAPGPAPISC